MINVGIIGKHESVQPVIEILRDLPEVFIKGKSLSGFMHRHENTDYFIPEINRVDLIEKADILIITKGANFAFDMLCDAIKKSKHILIAEHLKFSIDECNEIEKLSIESKSLVQFSNPLSYHPVILWISQNFPVPAYFDLIQSVDYVDLEDALFNIILLPVRFLGTNPLKVRSLFLPPASETYRFLNFRLEYGDSSVFNFNLNMNAWSKEFRFEGYSGKQFFTADILNNTLHSDFQPVHTDEFNPASELIDFFNGLKGENHIRTGISEYASGLKTLFEIHRRKG